MACQKATLRRLLKAFEIKIYGVAPNDIIVSSQYSIEMSSNEPTRGLLVSKFEENSIRQSLRYTKREWKGLSPLEKAEEIAVYRINRKMEYVKLLKELDKI